jgi:RNA:NAD 2'-phosphotransferase (TPT1/KptA family)
MKAVTGFLRHGRESGGNPSMIQPDGFCSVAVLCAHLHALRGVTAGALLAAAQGAHRLEVSEGRIRARNGHTLAHIKDFQPIASQVPKVLYHATTEWASEQIMQKGLKSGRSQSRGQGGRGHIHLSSNPEKKSQGRTYYGPNKPGFQEPLGLLRPLRGNPNIYAAS